MPRRAPAEDRPRRWTLEAVTQLFPALAEGQAILVVDKNLEALTRIADRHTIIEMGHAVWSGASVELAADQDLQPRYLGV